MTKVAEKEPKKFRSPFTENGYWWDVPAGVIYRGDNGCLCRPALLPRYQLDYALPTPARAHALKTTELASIGSVSGDV